MHRSHTLLRCHVWEFASQGNNCFLLLPTGMFEHPSVIKEGKLTFLVTAHSSACLDLRLIKLLISARVREGFKPAPSAWLNPSEVSWRAACDPQNMERSSLPIMGIPPWAQNRHFSVLFLCYLDFFLIVWDFPNKQSSSTLQLW